ncbi:hypothetical protein GCM10022233_50530 [Streptomyces shaanxiensis]|uniref:Uncharacterized protein n=1 Tax=Streptomyces shaanxiensis TaxID=653357 RepID=A0ABP7VKU9_9ACTN
MGVRQQEGQGSTGGREGQAGGKATAYEWSFSVRLVAWGHGAPPTGMAKGAVRRGHTGVDAERPCERRRKLARQAERIRSSARIGRCVIKTGGRWRQRRRK